MMPPEEMETSTAIHKTNTNACREANPTGGEEMAIVFAAELMTSVQAAQLKATTGLLKHYGGRRMTLARHQTMFREAQRMKAVEAARGDQEKRTTELKLAQLAEQFEEQKQVHNIKSAYLARLRQKFFRFMDMPREMRHAVHEHLAIDIELGKSGTIEITVEGGPRLSLLLVSRQFGKEYSETISRAAKLIMRDQGEEPVPRMLEFYADNALAGATKFTAVVELKLLAICDAPYRGHTNANVAHCNAPREIREHILWIRALSPQIRCIRHGQISMLLCASVAKDVDATGARWPAPILRHDFKPVLKELVCPSGLDVNVRYAINKVASEARWSWQEEWPNADSYGSWTPEEGWKAGAEDEKREETTS